jgi:hypothetical protein
MSPIAVDLDVPKLLNEPNIPSTVPSSPKNDAVAEMTARLATPQLISRPTATALRLDANSTHSIAYGMEEDVRIAQFLAPNLCELHRVYVC